jgi:hypothetical protein
MQADLLTQLSDPCTGLADRAEQQRKTMADSSKTVITAVPVRGGAFWLPPLVENVALAFRAVVESVVAGAADLEDAVHRLQNRGGRLTYDGEIMFGERYLLARPDPDTWLGAQLAKIEAATGE